MGCNWKQLQARGQSGGVRYHYVEDPPADVASTLKLLHEYSKIPEDEAVTHIREVRARLWDAFRYPSIGSWRFLVLPDDRDSATYQTVLGRLRDNGRDERLLDLGCCVGQVLRQLACNGVDGSKLYGTDLKRDFVDAGYELFRDRDTFGATFAVGDVLDTDDEGLRPLDGQVTMVAAHSFFHLFNWEQQVAVGERIVRFLRPGGVQDALVYGRQVGSVRPGPSGFDGRPDAAGPYIHDGESFQRLWDEVGEKTGTRWHVWYEHQGPLLDDGGGGGGGVGLPGNRVHARRSRFAVRQVGRCKSPPWFSSPRHLRDLSRALRRRLGFY